MGQPLRLLMVEDSEDDALLIVRTLRRGGYDVDYTRVDTAEAMRAALREREWDLVIADYALPGFDGLEALRLVHEHHLDLPFIIVSGAIGEETAVEAMRAGAHDYLMKGNLARLLPAVRRELEEAKVRRERRRAEYEQQRLLARTRRQHDTLLQLVTHPALAGGNLDEALHVIAQAAVEALDVTLVGIWRYLQDYRYVQCVAIHDRSGRFTQWEGERRKASLFPPYLDTVREGRLLVMSDIEVAAHELMGTGPTPVDLQVQALIGVPIHLHAQVIGGICYGHADGERRWYPDEVTFATHVAHLVAQAFLNADLHRRAEELATITRVSREITAVNSLQHVLDSIARNAAELANADGSAVYGFQPDGRLRLEAVYGIPAALAELANLQGVPMEGSAIGRAIAQRRPVQIADLLAEPEDSFYDLAAQAQIRGVLAVPLMHEAKVIGGIVLWSREPRHFTPEEVAFQQALAQQCVNAIENARLFAAEAQRRREAETLRNVAQILSSTLELPRVLELLLSELEKVIPYDSASIQQFRDGELEIIGGRGFPNPEEVLGKRIPVDARDSPNGMVVRTREPLILGDAPILYDVFNREAYGQVGVRSWMGVPLILRDRFIGIITLGKREANFYTSEHARLAMAFATQAASAIENARLFAEEEQRAIQLARALEQQRELARLKGQFVQNVSHELRTPLAIVRGYADLLESEILGELSPSQKEAITIIARKTRTLCKMVEDISTILELEEQDLRWETVDFGALVQDTVEEFRELAEKAHLRLDAIIADNLPSITGNALHLRRVVDNLLSNAVKFTPAGGRVFVSLERRGDGLVLEVKDTGIGIPEDQFERIFERFYQVDGSTSRRYGGTGLGLALVKEIVETYSGHVTVTSKLGEGSTFRVYLPLAPLLPR